MKYINIITILMLILFLSCVDFTEENKKVSGNEEKKAITIPVNGTFTSGTLRDSTDKLYYKFFYKNSKYVIENNVSKYRYYYYNISIKWISGDDFNIFSKIKISTANIYSLSGAAPGDKKDYYSSTNYTGLNDGYLIVEISDYNSTLAGRGVFEISVLEEIK